LPISNRLLPISKWLLPIHISGVLPSGVYRVCEERQLCLLSLDALASLVVILFVQLEADV
jgi:hypothetical protein